MSPKKITYDRESAVKYAHQWAKSRNPIYYNYDKLGGDCTNFASQCIFAGSKVMNYERVLGWYYLDANDKSPSWTGVPFLWNFLVSNNKVGPYAVEVSIKDIEPGDVVQLSFDGIEFQHSPFVVETGKSPDLDNVLIAAHSIDSDNRPLSTYNFNKIRFLHILGVRN